MFDLQDPKVTQVIFLAFESDQWVKRNFLVLHNTSLKLGSCKFCKVNLHSFLGVSLKSLA